MCFVSKFQFFAHSVEYPPVITCYMHRSCSCAFSISFDFHESLETNLVCLPQYRVTVNFFQGKYGFVLSFALWVKY